MRYTAENLRGCLVETMARFRPNTNAEALLAAVQFVAPEDDPELPTVWAVNDWLAELDTHPLVREAIDNSTLSDGDLPVHLDAGLIRLGGDVGRPITQAVSRAVHEEHPEVDGIAYWSRIDSSERCWAIYGHVPVDVVITDLSVDDPQHRAAVQDVAALLKVPLPPAWR